MYLVFHETIVLMTSFTSFSLCSLQKELQRTKVAIIRYEQIEVHEAWKI